MSEVTVKAGVVSEPQNHLPSSPTHFAFKEPTPASWEEMQVKKRKKEVWEQRFKLT